MSEPHSPEVAGENAEKEQPIKVLNVNVVAPDGQTIPLQVTLSDNVQDIRQYLLESPETVFVTSYHLELNGEKINDFIGLEELPELKDGVSFYVVEDPYTEASARVNVDRLKEILLLQPSSRLEHSPAMLSASLASPNDYASVEVPGLGPQANAEHFFSKVSVNPKCVKKLCYSGWNPVPGKRRLQGELFYLDLETLEGKVYVITAWTNGFFVNASNGTTEFNPAPSPQGYKSHSLANLLKQVSPLFVAEFTKLLSNKFDSHPYESIPVPFPVTNWLHQPQVTTYDNDHVETALREAAESDFFIQGQYHDWNEELQSCREHSRATQQDKIARERGIFRVYTDFVEAATRGAIATVDGNVPPINPTEEKRVHMFIYNNIFFSYAVDSRDFFKAIGGDMAAYKSASHDLLGVRAYDAADVEKLFTLATAVIDYRGYRIVAQSIVPGLFSGLMQDESAVEIIYGTLDGKKIKADPQFHEVLTEAAQKLSIKPHSVVDSEGNTAELASHADIKGIRGSDGRMYVLDLVRHTPRDANYADDFVALLRPELIDNYLMTEKEKLRVQMLKELELPLEIQVPKEPTPEESEKYTKIEEALSKITISMNVDALSQYKLAGAEEEMNKDVELLNTLASFLKDTQLPRLVESITTKSLIIDGQSLASEFHSFGINMRYLGTVAQLVQQHKNKTAHLELVLHREMIIRVMKHIFAEYLQNAKDYHLADTVVEVLNAFFGRYSRGGKGSFSGVTSAAEVLAAQAPAQNQKKPAEKPQKVKQNKNKQTTDAHLKKRLPQVVSAEPLGLTHNALWKEIRSRVTQKYKYTLPDEIPAQFFTLPTLRGICLRVGIQLEAKAYNFEKENVLSSNDVIKLFPVVKHAAPKASEGYDLLGAGRSLIAQGHYDVAYELISEANVLFQEVYGILHQDIAVCFRILAFILHQVGEHQQAVIFQQKALIITERLSGLDHFEVPALYHELARYQSSLEKPANIAAVNYGQRALYLFELIAGSTNKECLQHFLFLATLFESQEKTEKAIHYYSAAQDLSDRLFAKKNGVPDKLRKADLNHHLALLNQALGKFQEALVLQTSVQQIYLEVFGEKDPRTRAAAAHCELLAKNEIPKPPQEKASEEQNLGNLSVSEIMQVLMGQSKNSRNVHRLGSLPSKSLGNRRHVAPSSPRDSEGAESTPTQNPSASTKQPEVAQNQSTQTAAKKKRRRNKKK